MITLEPGQTWMVVRGPNIGALVNVAAGADGRRVFSGTAWGKPLELVLGEDALGPIPEPREASFASRLVELDVAYARAAPLRHARLLPGLTVTEAASTLARHDITMPEEYGLLHAWRDGFEQTLDPWPSEHEPDCFYEQIPLSDLGDTFLPHEHVLATLDLWAQLRESFTSEGRPCHFRRGFIPLLECGSYGYVVIDTLGSFGGRPGQILSFDYKSSSDFTILHESLDKWLETMVALLDAGVMFDRLGSEARRIEWTLNGPYRHSFCGIPIETLS